MKIKLDIVSGFLGAGKTTLIKKLVTEGYKDEKIVVLENEFGKVGIDTDILKNTGVEVEEITAGCICCSSSGDFLSSMEDIINKFSPNRIIVEPTGVAKLSEILRACNDFKFKGLFEANNIISVLDVKRFDFVSSYSKVFVDDQIAVSKTIVLSKNIGASIKHIEDIYSYIKNININANIINEDIYNISGQELVNAIENEIQEYDMLKLLNKLDKTAETRNPYHFATLEFKTHKPIDYENIELIFKCFEDEDTYGKVVRGKGILQNSEQNWYKFDYVENEIQEENYYKEDIGAICIIGYKLNKKNILNLFD